MQQLLAFAERPTAVFLHNNILAIGTMRAIYDGGLGSARRCVTGGIRRYASAAYLSPPSRRFRIPKVEIGTLAGRTIWSGAGAR